MKILAHIATFNDIEIVDQCIQGLLNQTYPVSEIIVVDNGSTDGILHKVFPSEVTLIRHAENQGTNGAVVTGFKYALARDFDWMWVFDADSVPRKDALQQLMQLHNSLPPDLQSRIRVLGSLPVDAANQTAHHGIIFTPRGFTKGFVEVKPQPDQPYYECDSTIWSGSLFNLQAVRHIGLPPEDLVLDWGDHEYGYRGKMAGYKAIMSQQSIIDHNLHPMPTTRYVRFGPFSLRTHSSPPIRRYYFFRNFLFFWFYEFRRESLRASFLPYLYLLKLIVQMLKIGILNNNPRNELSACLRGVWDGLCKNLHHRF